MNSFIRNVKSLKKPLIWSFSPRKATPSLSELENVLQKTTKPILQPEEQIRSRSLPPQYRHNGHNGIDQHLSVLHGGLISSPNILQSTSTNNNTAGLLCSTTSKAISIRFFSQKFDNERSSKVKSPEKAIDVADKKQKKMRWSKAFDRVKSRIHTTEKIRKDGSAAHLHYSAATHKSWEDIPNHESSPPCFKSKDPAKARKTLAEKYPKRMKLFKDIKEVIAVSEKMKERKRQKLVVENHRRNKVVSFFFNQNCRHCKSKNKKKTDDFPKKLSNNSNQQKRHFSSYNRVRRSFRVKPIKKKVKRNNYNDILLPVSMQEPVVINTNENIGEDNAKGLNLCRIIKERSEAEKRKKEIWKNSMRNNTALFYLVKQSALKEKEENLKQSEEHTNSPKEEVNDLDDIEHIKQLDFKFDAPNLNSKNYNFEPVTNTNIVDLLVNKKRKKLISELKEKAKLELNQSAKSKQILLPQKKTEMKSSLQKPIQTKAKQLPTIPKDPQYEPGFNLDLLPRQKSFDNGVKFREKDNLYFHVIRGSDRIILTKNNNNDVKNKNVENVEVVQPMNVTDDEMFFLHPKDSVEQNICNTFPGQAEQGAKVIMDEQAKEVLANTIRSLIQPVIEKEFLKYDEVVTAIQRLEKKLASYLNDSNSLKLRPCNQFSNQYYNEKLQKSQNSYQLKLPIKQEEEQKDPNKNINISDPLLDKLKDYKEPDVVKDGFKDPVNEKQKQIDPKLGVDALCKCEKKDDKKQEEQAKPEKQQKPSVEITRKEEVRIKYDPCIKTYPKKDYLRKKKETDCVIKGSKVDPNPYSYQQSDVLEKKSGDPKSSKANSIKDDEGLDLAKKKIEGGGCCDHYNPCKPRNSGALKDPPKKKPPCREKDEPKKKNKTEANDVPPMALEECNNNDTILMSSQNKKGGGGCCTRDEDTCTKSNPCKLKVPPKKKDPCKDKEEPCKPPCHRDDPCKKADNVTISDQITQVLSSKKTPSSGCCNRDEDPCSANKCKLKAPPKKKDPCKNDPDPCSDPCKKQDPCKKKASDSCGNEEPPCPPIITENPCMAAKKIEPCKIEDPCEKVDPCSRKKEDPCEKEDPCKEPEPCIKENPCMSCRKENSLKKEEPCHQAEPCQKMQSTCGIKDNPCKKTCKAKVEEPPPCEKKKKILSDPFKVQPCCPAPPPEKPICPEPAQEASDPCCGDKLQKIVNPCKREMKAAEVTCPPRRECGERAPCCKKPFSELCKEVDFRSTEPKCDEKAQKDYPPKLKGEGLSYCQKLPMPEDCPLKLTNKEPPTGGAAICRQKDCQLQKCTLDTSKSFPPPCAEASPKPKSGFEGMKEIKPCSLEQKPCTKEKPAEVSDKHPSKKVVHTRLKHFEKKQVDNTRDQRYCRRPPQPPPAPPPSPTVSSCTGKATFGSSTKNQWAPVTVKNKKIKDVKSEACVAKKQCSTSSSKAKEQPGFIEMCKDLCKSIMGVKPGKKCDSVKSSRSAPNISSGPHIGTGTLGQSGESSGNRKNKSPPTMQCCMQDAFEERNTSAFPSANARKTFSTPNLQGIVCPGAAKDKSVPIIKSYATSSAISPTKRAFSQKCKDLCHSLYGHLMRKSLSTPNLPIGERNFSGKPKKLKNGSKASKEDPCCITKKPPRLSTWSPGMKKVSCGSKGKNGGKKKYPWRKNECKDSDLLIKPSACKKKTTSSKQKKTSSQEANDPYNCVKKKAKKSDSGNKKEESCNKTCSTKKEDPCKKKEDTCKKKEDPCKKKKEDPCKKKEEDPCKKKKEDPCKKKEEDPCKKKKEDPCKKKEDPCKKKEDPCKKKEDPCKKKEDPCKKKEDPCKKKEDPCKKKEDPCKKTCMSKNDDPCKKKEDPCKKKEDPCKKKEDPCKKKEDPCKKKEDPCKKKEDPCKNKEDPCKKKEDPCKKSCMSKSDDPCKKKEDPCKKKEDPCKKKEDPCKKKEDPCKKKEDPCKKKEDPCKKKEDPCKKKEDPCKKKKEDPCKKKCASPKKAPMGCCPDDACKVLEEFVKKNKRSSRGDAYNCIKKNGSKRKNGSPGCSSSTKRKCSTLTQIDLCTDVPKRVFCPDIAEQFFKNPENSYSIEIFKKKSHKNMKKFSSVFKIPKKFCPNLNPHSFKVDTLRKCLLSGVAFKKWLASEDYQATTCESFICRDPQLFSEVEVKMTKRNAVANKSKYPWGEQMHNQEYENFNVVGTEIVEFEPFDPSDTSEILRKYFENISRRNICMEDNKDESSGDVKCDKLCAEKSNENKDIADKDKNQDEILLQFYQKIAEKSKGVSEEETDILQ